MRHIFVAALAALALLVASCAPVTTVQPQEYTTRLNFEQAYAETINVISTQPYPSDSSGWVITQSDQVGGFISAELRHGVPSGLFGLRLTQETAVVSVTLVRRGTDVSVSVGRTRHEEARSLAARISERLGL